MRIGIAVLALSFLLAGCNNPVKGVVDNVYPPASSGCSFDQWGISVRQLGDDGVAGANDKVVKVCTTKAEAEKYSPNDTYPKP
jgi:hypothetical protein